MIETKIFDTVRRYGLLESSKNVTVALSGGADSMTLLYALLSLRERLGITVSAAHFNHGIRGAEADRDEKFVRDECAKLKIPFFCEQGDVPAYAQSRRISTELAARELRYKFLHRVNQGVVATAHTASDNLETMLFNLTRGTALTGLCGIPAKRDIFIRPLLFCTREEIEQYCRTNNICFMTDSTNCCDDYSRNRLRHHVVPVLRGINPSVERAASHTAASLYEDNDFLGKTAAEEYQRRLLPDNRMRTDRFDMLHPAISKRVVRLFYRSVSGGVDTDGVHLGQLDNICRFGGKTSLPERRTAIVCDRVLTVVPDGAISPATDFSVTIKEENQNFWGLDKKINNLLLKSLLDCDKIVGKLVLRTRRPGDCIRLKNKNGTKTLKKLMNEYKIPLCERETLPVFSDDRGVVYVYRIGVAERCAIGEQTKRFLRISVAKNDFQGDDSNVVTR